MSTFMGPRCTVCGMGITSGPHICGGTPTFAREASLPDWVNPALDAMTRRAEAAEAELAAARAENERMRAGIEAALVVIDGHDRHQHLFARRIRRALLDGASS